MCGSQPRMSDGSAAHSAQWQDLELIFRWLLQHGNMCERREGVAHASLRPAETFMHACLRPTESCMFPCTKMRKQSSGDCCRYAKVFMTCIRSLLLYRINMQSAVCATYLYTNTDWHIFCTQKR